MYAEVDLSVLKPAITRLSKVTATRTTLPVLQNIRIDAADNRLLLSANNLETALRFSIPAKVDVDGVTTANGRMLSALLSRIHGEELTLLTSNGQGMDKFSLYIPDGPKITIPAIDAEEFPPMLIQDQFEERYFLDAGEFRALMYGTSFAATTDDARPVLQHIQLEFTPGKLTASATDGFRIAVKSTPIEGISESFQVLIPSKMVDAALRLLPIVTGEKVVIGLKSTNEEKRAWVMIGAGNAYITGCLSDGGKFPDWRALVSNDCKYSYKLNRKQLVAALDLSLLITGKWDARIILDFPNGKMTTSNEERGEFVFSMPAVTIGEPAPFIAAMNNHYLIDGLRHMKGDTVTMYLNSPKNTFQFEDDGGLAYVVMPLFIG